MILRIPEHIRSEATFSGACPFSVQEKPGPWAGQRPIPEHIRSLLVHKRLM